jgi:AraC-like DNA-binding protein
MTEAVMNDERICHTPAVMERDSVSVAFVREALEGLHRRGVDPAPLLASAGIAGGALTEAEARIPAAAFARLWRAVARAIDDEFFACDTRPMRVGSYATLCHLMLHTRNLHQALRRGLRLVNLLLDDTRARLEVDGSQARLCFDSPRGAPQVFAHETLFVMLYGLSCWLVGRRLPVRQAAFAYPPPPWAAEYPRIYSREIVFDAERTAFSFAAVDLAAPVVQTERTARDFLRHAPANIVVKYKDAESLSAYVRRRLRSAAPGQMPGFEALAESLGMSLSTLRRRLDAEGTSYRLLKDGLRRDAALRQLSQSRKPVAEIALALGFTEPSAFHRAFRQWTGVSPGDYRQGRAPARPLSRRP